MKKKTYDDVLLDHLAEARQQIEGDHVGHARIRQHIEAQQERTDRAIVGQFLDHATTQYERGFRAGLEFCLNAPRQVYELRKAELDEERGM